MKVAIQLACLFAWFHERRFAFGSVRPSGIMIDKNFNIKVFDFGFLAPVRVEDNGVPVYYSRYVDAREARARYGVRTLKADVSIFGVLLVELLGNNYRDIKRKMALTPGF
ncbi:LEAF RUST 10 DISEASE-RESISTANCE LOCUS RECEPTOR-LIKE PROTEIN KINASE-like 1.1 [Lycium barbarum]|uniref:LEAF RUST 10 DISEASE-RESISTANCE LOCUS RECEPTOR-LIKE PROTEIN KINASE-like 1.1 n=1 Tax=Lycium barbarum TaxID=112863 RepID=UPI00293E8295|nr:LEAF RUST 10 DISEASE-RESISTANCE LOCUS RECEPTOR-LIKE PROTEIN KINASE-like 1.1 [Lycium barbarum]XP_060197489.1 LEAF RUST 10 DISEASE-RESISTANCE LOCUS RECEPTOR-LIKE PROTEIN KINASE-like 1.1 [Lycium barbarum]